MAQVRPEEERLRQVSEWYSNRTGFYSQLVVFGFRSLKEYFVPGNVLEMGSADGHMTELISTRFDDVSVVDGSPAYVDTVLGRLPHVKGYASLFEEFEPPEQYDNIVMAHILEHVENPVGILQRAAGWLAPSGRILVIVPNASSVHRLVGVKMGMLASPTDLNEDDVRIGHRRVYTPETLLADIAAAGLKVIDRTGIFFKPISNSQIEQQWSQEMIEGFYELGRDFPDLATEILVACEI
jgi:2-polyprenyl-3-methyl-5-hydroxy-6-metoxy-1,4-benzoquinol methylase